MLKEKRKFKKMKKKTKKGVRCGQIIGLASWEMERDREQKVGDGMWPFHNGISIVWPMEANQQKPEKMLILSEWKYYLKCSSSCEKFRILLSCFICIFEAELFSWKALQASVQRYFCDLVLFGTVIFIQFVKVKVLLVFAMKKFSAFISCAETLLSYFSQLLDTT